MLFLVFKIISDYHLQIRFQEDMEKLTKDLVSEKRINNRQETELRFEVLTF